MSELVYSVTGTFSDDAVAQEWVSWLRDGHVNEVLRLGATDAEIVRFDGLDHTYEVRYHFPSREAFVAYERDHAPRLRAEALRRFPAERRIAYRRSSGDLIARLPQ